jgi:hypothetical protein
MDCKTARVLLDFHRPRVGELAPDEAIALERHLATCPECDAANRAERRLDDHFGRVMRDVPLPDHLRERLLTRLREERAAALRRKLAWGARALVAAAVLLLGVFVAWRLAGPKPVTLDPNALVVEDFQKYNPRSAQQVQEAFRERYHIDMVAPALFDYGYLAEYEPATLQGKRVAKLIFQRSQDQGGIVRARVYVLTADQFDLPALLASLPENRPEIESLDRRLRVLPSDKPDTIYLIIYEGDSLEPLLDPRKGA